MENLFPLNLVETVLEEILFLTVCGVGKVTI